MKKRIKLTFTVRDALIGLFFISPFIIGTILFFAYPTITSFLMSFGNVDKNSGNMSIIFSGTENYVKAFIEDTEFVPKLLESMKEVAVKTPLIVIFSLLIAILLNKITRFRAFFRVVIILPFLIGSGNVMSQLLSMEVDKNVLLFSGSNISVWINNLMGGEIGEIIDLFFSVIVLVLWSGSVQILLFLSAIQSTNPALYEAARIDGAGEYSIFWKITLPTVMPILLLNAVYTIINTFTSSTNPLLYYIKKQSLSLGEHGYAAALGWIYFAFIIVFIGIVVFILSKCTKATYS